MSYATDIGAHSVAQEDTPSDLRRGSWKGPALGAGILTILWAIYLAPVFIGIMSAWPGA